MSKNASFNKAGLGAVGIALTGGMLLASSAFAAQPMANGYLLTAAPTSKTAEGKCGDESFAKTDANNDGKVSKAEFLAVAPKREADFNSIDGDKNGFISQAEAYKFLRSVYEANGKEMPADKFSIAAVLGK